MVTENNKGADYRTLLRLKYELRFITVLRTDKNYDLMNSPQLIVDMQ